MRVAAAIEWRSQVRRGAQHHSGTFSHCKCLASTHKVFIKLKYIQTRGQVNSGTCAISRARQSHAQRHTPVGFQWRELGGPVFSGECAKNKTVYMWGKETAKGPKAKTATLAETGSGATGGPLPPDMRLGQGPQGVHSPRHETGSGATGGPLPPT